MHVLKTMQDDGVATLTISIGDDDHKFEVWADGDIAKVQYEETLTWRGQIETAEPDESIIKELMISQEMTEFLDEHALDKVTKADPKP